MKTHAHQLPRILGLLLAAFALSCTSTSTDGDASSSSDVQVPDTAATSDAGDVAQPGADAKTDAATDAGPGDAGGGDGGPADGGPSDSGPTVPDTDDAGATDTTDASIPDTTDASIPDTTDASIPDTTDASIPDTTDASIPDTTDAGPADTTDAGPTDTGPTDTGPTDAAPTDAGPDDIGADSGPSGNPACETPKPVPMPFTTISGFGSSEDFAMDYAGNVVLNKGGSIARISPSGQIHIVAPNAGATAGISVLSNDDIVFCAGDKLKIAYASGGYDTIIAGLNYPNGMDVDHEDFAYVAEQSGGRLRRVNPYTGEFQIIADKLPNPNGVAWAPGYKRIYVGSFGGGTVHYIDRLADGEWSKPVLFAKIDGDNTVTGPPPNPIEPPEVIYRPCDGKVSGAACITAAGWQGDCADMGGVELVCVQLPDALPPEEAACEGVVGTKKACTVSILGYAFHGMCQSSGFSADCCEEKGSPGCGLPTCEDCVCAADAFCCDNSWDNICVGETQSVCPTECNCDQSLPVDGPTSCAYLPNPTVFCSGLAEGDLCAYIEGPDAIFGGRCTDVSGLGLGSPFPTHGIACVPPKALDPGGGGGGGGGGLDGLNVDECGMVYVTEYVLGYLWRITPAGVITKAAKLSSWIPNIDFGRGVGGWPKTTMYVMDFTKNQLFALDIGVEGKWAVPPLP